MVSLVGAGPGDPGLFTLRGRELLAQADVIVYDALVNPLLLNWARKEAQLIYVGKIAGKHALAQEEINSLLVAKAQAGLNVVRLKGGDPYIFGRGGEEGEYLANHHIPFEEVPGITSAIAGPAYAGIPLTHRDFVSSVAIITGHEKPEKNQSAHNWRAYVESGSTLVFVMGVKNLSHITSSLIAAGMPAQTPAAIIFRGTTPLQRKLISTLEKLAEEATASGFTNPSVVVVGKVVGLHDDLDWYSSRPLLGKRIIVTRAREQASDITLSLQKLGAHVMEFPTIRIEPLEDYEQCDAAIAALSQYEWLIFTSVNGVKFFWKRLEAHGKDSRFLGQIKVAAIGPATAQALVEKGVRPDILPETYVAESVAEAIRDYRRAELNGKRILLPRAKKARNALPDQLRACGAIVDIVPVYETIPPAMDKSEIKEAIENGDVDCITFGSSSTVENFLSVIPAETLLKKPHMILAAIGPITAATLQQYGLSAAIQPPHFTIPGLIDAIVAFFNPKGDSE